jgi:hypothetical protein
MSEQLCTLDLHQYVTIRTIGLVVKFNVAIVEPRVRFPDGAHNNFYYLRIRGDPAQHGFQLVGVTIVQSVHFTFYYILR